MNTPGSTVDIMTRKAHKLGRYKINYEMHFEEFKLPNNARSSGSFVACNHDIMLNKQESSSILCKTVDLNALIGTAVLQHSERRFVFENLQTFCFS